MILEGHIQIIEQELLKMFLDGHLDTNGMSDLFREMEHILIKMKAEIHKEQEHSK